MSYRYVLEFHSQNQEVLYRILVKDNDEAYKEICGELDDLHDDGFSIQSCPELEASLLQNEYPMTESERQFISTWVKLSKQPQTLKRRAMRACVAFFNYDTLLSLRTEIPQSLYIELISWKNKL